MHLSNASITVDPFICRSVAPVMSNAAVSLSVWLHAELNRKRRLHDRGIISSRMKGIMRITSPSLSTESPLIRRRYQTVASEPFLVVLSQGTVASQRLKARTTGACCGSTDQGPSVRRAIVPTELHDDR